MRSVAMPFPPLMACIAVFVWLSLTGCAVGPDFLTPDDPVPDNFTSTPLSSETESFADVRGGEVQHFSMGGDIPGEWWKLFRSEHLDRLVRQAFDDSPTVAEAKAKLREAAENLNARAGTVYYPTLDGNVSASRSRSTGASFGQPDVSGNTFTLYNTSLNLSYTLDLFGGGQRELEALKAQADYQRFQLEATYLTLSANVVTSVIQALSLRSQIRETEEILVLQENQLKLVERQFELGGAERSDVLVQMTQLAQLRATLPPLEKELDQTRNQLAVYIGRFPSEAELLDFALDNLQLPEELPVSLPSTLARQRPDLRAAEELLHAASAQVGVSTANLYPQITLTGGLGSSAKTIDDLFGSGTSVWNLGAGILQPLFHGGELTAKRRASIAAFDQALAQYRQTVLLAFQSVADSLRALETDARTLKARAEAEAAARETLDIVGKQYDAGAVAYLSLLVAQLQHQQTRITLVQARAARFADTVALFQSLGGGWWNRVDTGMEKSDDSG